MNATTAPASPPITGHITLEAYVKLLERISREGIKNLNTLDPETHLMVDALLEDGLVSNPYSSVAGGRMVVLKRMVITPSGASALAQWSAHLREQTLLYKVGAAFVRFAWVIVGAFCAVLAELVR